MAVKNVPRVAALNSISSNPILLATSRLLGQGKGEFGRSASEIVTLETAGGILWCPDEVDAKAT
jgi:hypothetical protein